MLEIKELIAGVGLIWLAYNVFYIWIDSGYLPDTKPFNCITCISFWVTLILFCINYSIILLSLGLIYHIINRLISKL